MSTSNILIIDDEPEMLTAFAQLLMARHPGVVTEVVHPNEIEPMSLERAHVVLVDYNFEQWTPPKSLPVALRCPDGLALAATLQRHLVHAGRTSPTAFAVITAEPHRLAEPLPPVLRRHVLAQSLNLEWVFEKGQARLEDKVASLAAAVSQLPLSWSGSGEALERRKLLADLLALDVGRRNVLADVEHAVPPLHELTEWSHGLAVLRWLMHRVLPYPAFLWGHLYLAARLGVTVGWLDHQLTTGSQFRRVFSSCEYRGVLHDFVEVRWWRGLIEGLLWRETRQRSFDTDAVVRWLEDAVGGPVERCDARTPVVALGRDLVPESLVDMSEAVQVQPDDWPSYAMTAWVSEGLRRAHASELETFVVHQEGE